MLNIKPALLIALACMTLICVSGCKKSADEKNQKIKEASATILNAGSVAADGCGWLFIIGDVQYHADNFTGTPDMDKKKVILTADITDDRFRCGWTANQGPGIPVIHIAYMITL